MNINSQFCFRITSTPCSDNSSPVSKASLRNNDLYSHWRVSVKSSNPRQRLSLTLSFYYSLARCPEGRARTWLTYLLCRPDESIAFNAFYTFYKASNTEENIPRLYDPFMVETQLLTVDNSFSFFNNPTYLRNCLSYIF